MERDEDSIVTGSDDSQGVVVSIPHSTQNVCGVINEMFIITADADDSLKRDLAIYELCNDKDRHSKYFALFVRPEAQKKSACATFLAHYDVLKNAEGDMHLPSLVVAKPMKKLYFGKENIQQSEHDADWERPAMVVKMPDHCVFVVALRSLSPTGNIGSGLALTVGYGLVEALNSLHNKGFIHRFVTPWNFMIPMPFSVENIVNKMLIMDLSLAKRWDPETTDNVSVRFVGSLKYSSLRALTHRSVGPADDFISVIFIVAELISGKIPWRSVSKIQKCVAMREKFTESVEFKRMPREIRKLYIDLCMTPPNDQPIDNVFGAFDTALKRRVGKDWMMSPIPDWLEMPGE